MAKFKYSAGLEQFRGLAALFVFISHCKNTGLKLLPFLSSQYLGTLGIACFLALSGFLFRMLYPSDQPISWFSFMKQRCYRILPVYLIVLFLLQSLSGFSAGDLFEAILMQTNLIPRGPGAEFGPIWTLGIEFTFYMLLPFLLPVTSREGIRSSFTLVFIILFFNFILTFGEPSDAWRPTFFAYTGIPLFTGFLAGHCLLTFPIREKLSSHYKVALACFVLLLITSASLSVILAKFHTSLRPSDLFNKNDGYIDIPHFFFAPLLVVAIYISKGFPSIFGKLLEGMGLISYSFYLFHMPVLIAFNHILPDGQSKPELICLVTFVTSSILATLTYKYIELPFIRFGKFSNN